MLLSFQMRQLQRALSMCGLTALLGATACASLPPFGSDLGKQQIQGEDVRPPYSSLASYFGFIMPGAEPDEVRDGKKMYYVYLWLPAVTPEMGVRMLSPVKGIAKPQSTADFVDPAYDSNKDSDAYFDTWIRFERCLAAVNPEDITKPCAQWVTFGENDDSVELPAQPSGQKNNSVLRLANSNDDPLKTLVRGLYRIAFTTYKVGDVQGSYLIQVGAPVDLPGVVLARDTAELAKHASDKAGVLPQETPPKPE